MLLWVLQRMEGKLQVGVRPTLHCHEAAISGNRSDPRRRINTYNVELQHEGRWVGGWSEGVRMSAVGPCTAQKVQCSVF